MAKKKRNRQQASKAKTPPPALQALSPEEQAARRAQQKAEWAERKRGKERATGDSVAALYWMGGAIAVVVIAAIVGVILIAGGGGASSASPTPNASADPRLGGASPAESFNISAADDGVDINPRFSPNTITALAGEVFQINVKNDGSSAHNLVIAGLDNQYDTADDWSTTDPNNSSNPKAISPGDTGTVQVKIGTPGTYKFHCTFHPDQQTGTLILTAAPSASASPTPITTGSATPTPTASP